MPASVHRTLADGMTAPQQRPHYNSSEVFLLFLLIFDMPEQIIQISEYSIADFVTGTQLDQMIYISLGNTYRGVGGGDQQNWHTVSG